MHEPVELVGRATELAALEQSLGNALAGRGELWLLCGEPGIGKSRIAEEVSSLAEGRATVLWGSCWEAGGAPAYWPWIQVLRKLLRARGDAELSALLGTRACWLLQILPEIAHRLVDLDAPPSLDPAEARFQLFDTVSAALRDASDERPLLIVLEDLHAADTASLLMLDFVARELRHASMLVLATYRDAEASHSASGPLLSRVERHAHKLPLLPWDRDRVAEYLAMTLGAPPDPATVRSVWQLSEGIPLFVGEATRLLAEGGDVERIIPDGARGAIRARLAALPSRVHRTLSIASALGRDFTTSALARACEEDPAEVEASIRVAVGSAAIRWVAGESHRFSHILIREVLHDELPTAERRALHRRLADDLAARLDGPAPPPWSELAHHLLEAGPDARSRALDALEQTARDALEQLAFDDAVIALVRACEACDDSDLRRRAELWIELGRAHALTGDVGASKRACERAIDATRKLGDPELFARAALAHGSALVFAEVDAFLVSTLQEALEALDDEPSALRAEVMARLAAAMQPAEDPSVPIAIAHRAIAMAREVGDPAALLRSLRYGGSALMDLSPARDRRPLNEEMVALASRLRAPVDAWRGTQRLVFDALELNDRAGVDQAIDACERIANELSHAEYRWPVAALRAMTAIFEGRVDAAEHCHAEARRLAAKTANRGAPRTLTLQRMGILRLNGSSSAAQWLEIAEHISTWTGLMGLLGDAFVIEALARGGQTEAARRKLDGMVLSDLLRLGDMSLVEPIVYALALLGDRRWVTELLARLGPERGRFVSWGTIGMVWGPPVRFLLGYLHRSAGDIDAARRELIEAEREARSLGGLAWAEAAARLAGSLEPNDDVVSPPADEASESPSPARLSTPPAEGFSMLRTGDAWSIRHAGTTFQVRHTKGMALLARLVAHPGREFHALDLSGSSLEEGSLLGEGTELIDKTARAAYERRVHELREQLEEAELLSDMGRAEVARAELDAIATELARAVGLGGRHRKAGGAAERARVNVQRRLRDAIARIEIHDPALARHLGWAVRTGAFCSYDPG